MQNKIIGASGNIKVKENEQEQIIIDIDESYGGQSSINTLGTIVQGTWSAGVIDPSVGGTGVNNKDKKIALEGNVYISGDLTLDCQNGAIVQLPANGLLVNREQALDPLLNLKDCLNPYKAFDNISPTGKKGDMVAYDGNCNRPISAGKDGEVLFSNSLTELGLNWQPLPISYSMIIHDDKTFTNQNTIKFEGCSFNITQLDDGTNIKLSKILEDLSNTQGFGILSKISRNNEESEIKAIKLKNGRGITIHNPHGQEDIVVEISDNFCGQKTIDTLGCIKEGEWNGQVISPEFGGTGNVNYYKIALGGEIKTDCAFNIKAQNQNKKIVFHVKDNVNVEIPENGVLATVQDSLQKIHNLGDVENTTQAFSNISPTKERGDLIVRGYGDYDIALKIGDNLNVLVVDKNQPGCIKWHDLKIKEQCLEVIKMYEAHKKALRQEKKTKKPVAPISKINGISAQKRLYLENNLIDILNTVLLQIDHMTRAGYMHPIKELKELLGEIDKA